MKSVKNQEMHSLIAIYLSLKHFYISFMKKMTKEIKVHEEKDLRKNKNERKGMEM